MNSITQILFIILTITLGRVLFEVIGKKPNWVNLIKITIVNGIISLALGYGFALESSNEGVLFIILEEGLIVFTVWQILIIGIFIYKLILKKKKSA